MTSVVWEVMNDLEMITSKICSAREMIDIAAESIQNSDYDRAEAMANAAYEFLGYYLEEFDVKFKKAWKETVVKSKEDDGMRPWGHSDLEYLIANPQKPLSCDKDDPSPECQGAWNDFWEENYYPEEYQYTATGEKFPTQYTEEELNAMCDKAASDQEKDKCREYNLREAEYYNQRARLDADVAAIKAAGGYEWTPDPQVSRNDPTRLKYEDGWVYESPDGGKTVTKRKVGSTEKIVVKEDKPKKWVLPVEEVKDEDTDENIYCVTFPDDLLEAADLKEGDDVEWVDKGDGSYLLRKVARPLRMDEC